LKKIIIVCLLLLSMIGCVFGCSQPQSTYEPEEELFPYEYFTIYPEGNETTFELEPNDCCSIIVYLEENQIMEVSFYLTPSDLSQEFITVGYSHPEGQNVSIGQVWNRRDFETLPHGEGYYSIDFCYDAYSIFSDLSQRGITPPEGMSPSSLPDIEGYVQWEIKIFE